MTESFDKNRQSVLLYANFSLRDRFAYRKWTSKFHLVCFTIFCRGCSLYVAKCLAKVAGRRKAQNSCDLRERKVRLGQETLSFFYAAVDDIIDGRNTVFALKGVYHIIFGDADLFCQLVQRDIFLIMVVNVALYRCTLAVGRQAGAETLALRISCTTIISM